MGRPIQASLGGAIVYYQPGGTNDTRQRTTLHDALSLAQDIGAAEVRIDGSLAQQPVTEARAYDWRNVALGLAYWSGGPFTLDIIPGTTFDKLERVGGGLYLNNKAAAPVMSIAGAAEITFADGAGVTTDATGVAPLLKVLAGGTLYLYIGGNSFFDGQGFHAVVEAASTSFVQIGAAPGSTIAANTLTGAGTINVLRGLGLVKWATVDPAQTGAAALTIDPA